ncbi:MAG: hypothetical protein IJX80_03385 [Clostridia bacterium]|nr:hypothetical protein [Clostridia bacterium]
MKCGFFELDVTPALGSVIPGDFAARYSDEILDALYVRAFVAQNESKTLAIASIDACGITADITEKIRTRVAARIPIAPTDIMVMATHAHGGGPTLTWGEEVVRDEDYLKLLTAKTADAICEAWRRAEDSALYVGSEELFDVSYVRVYRMKGNRLLTNPGKAMIDEIEAPCTTIDPEVLVLAVKQKDTFVGALIHFTTHPATVATTQITGDYISGLSAKMKQLYGSAFVTVYINGACGNINHLNPFDDATRAKDRYRTVGESIAEKAHLAISHAKKMEARTLYAASETVDVKLRKPDESQLLAAKQLFDSLGDGLIDSVPGTPNYINTFFALQAFWIMADKQTVRRVQLQLFKIGDCYLVGTPTQLFVEYGKRMKSIAPGRCFVSAFANDYCGYVPTPECMKEGVYEARLAKTSALEPAAGDKITDAVIEMMKRAEAAH